MKAEEAHEVGRQGVMRAKQLLWQILGEAIDLPFNAYDHRDKLTFMGLNGKDKEFSFDLKGILRKKDTSRAMGDETVEVFVEVKHTQSGDDLLGEYREFLKRSATVSLKKDHSDSWFIFIASVPFGTTCGITLCDGSILSELQKNWTGDLEATSPQLHQRICLVIATRSFERLLKKWGRDV